ILDSLDCLCGLDGLSSRFTGRRERAPRGSPGTGRGGGAHREPVVKVGGAPGARPGRGEAGRRGSGIGSWRGWGAVPVVLRGSPLRLGRHREHGIQQMVDNVNKLRDANFDKIFLIQIMNEYALEVFD